jgi:hypothetical protein
LANGAAADCVPCCDYECGSSAAYPHLGAPGYDCGYDCETSDAHDCVNDYAPFLCDLFKKDLEESAPAVL